MGPLLFGIVLLGSAIHFALALVLHDRRYLLLSPFSFFHAIWLSVFSLYLTGDDFLQERTVAYFLLFYVLVSATGVVATIVGARVAAGRRTNGGGARAIVGDTTVAWALIALQLLSVACAASYLGYAASFIDLGLGQLIDNPADVARVRGVLATQDYDVPSLIRLLNQSRYVNYFAPIAFLVFRREGLLGRRWFIASIGLALLYPLLFLERSGVLKMLIVVSVAHLYLSRTLRFASLRPLIVAALLFGTLSVFVLGVRRTDTEASTGAYAYVVGALSGLDAFVSGYRGEVVTLEPQGVYITRSGYRFGDAPFGLETFPEVYRLMRWLGLSDVYVAKAGEYVYSPVYTNIYTALRPLLQDFGPIGMAFVVVLFGLGAAFAYAFGYRRGGIFGTYLIAYLAYVAIFSFATNNFLARELVIVYVACVLLDRWPRTGFGRSRALSHG